MNPLFILFVIMLAILSLVWLGLNVKPASFPTFAISQEPPRIPLPTGLPAPVERYYRKTYGESVPVITSAVLSGRGRMAPFGVFMPMRFRILYENATHFRSYIEATFFGLPVFNGDEYYRDGAGQGRTPGGIDKGPKFDQSIHVRMWSEMLNWLPAVLVTDQRVRWEPLDDSTAILVVPAVDKEERIIVRFDPVTGGMQYFEVMRYHNNGKKILFINGMWLMEQGKPWIHLDIESALYNVDVHDAIRSETGRLPVLAPSAQ